MAVPPDNEWYQKHLEICDSMEDKIFWRNLRVIAEHPEEEVVGYHRLSAIEDNLEREELMSKKWIVTKEINLVSLVLDRACEDAVTMFASKLGSGSIKVGVKVHADSDHSMIQDFHSVLCTTPSWWNWLFDHKYIKYVATFEVGNTFYDRYEECVYQLAYESDNRRLSLVRIHCNREKGVVGKSGYVMGTMELSIIDMASITASQMKSIGWKPHWKQVKINRINFSYK